MTKKFTKEERNAIPIFKTNLDILMEDWWMILVALIALSIDVRIFLFLFLLYYKITMTRKWYQDEWNNELLKEYINEVHNAAASGGGE